MRMRFVAQDWPTPMELGAETVRVPQFGCGAALGLGFGSGFASGFGEGVGWASAGRSSWVPVRGPPSVG